MARNGRNPKSPAFQLYPADFLSDPKVQAMSATEVGVYCLLLFQSWIDGGIPNDPVILAKRTRLSLEKFKRAWLAVGPCWVESGESRLTNPRQERERLFQSENRERLSRISRKGNAARWKADFGSHVGSHVGSPCDPEPSAPVPDTRTRYPTPDDTPPSAGAAQAKRPRKPATGPNADCIRHWEAEWARTRSGAKYAGKVKDWVAVAWMLQQEPPPEVRRRMTAILNDRDEWTFKRASLTHLESRWNEYGAGRPHQLTADELPSSGLLEMIADVKANR